jgi:hypothetical protein
MSAHRASYELHIGSIAEGLVIRHTCDNPPCVNPDHLVAGTPEQNTQDMLDRNRQAKGMSVPTCKLAPEQVVEIRAALGAGRTQKEVASIYGVSPATISGIHLGRTWKWLLPSHQEQDAA